MEVQTRSQTGELRYYTTLEAALADAKQDIRVWKVSFNAEDGTRIRLIRTEIGWVYEHITNGERFVG